MNRSTTVALGCKVQEELWPSKQVNYSFLRTLVVIFILGFLKSTELSLTLGQKSIFSFST